MEQIGIRERELTASQETVREEIRRLTAAISKAKEVNELFASIPKTRVYLMAGDQDYMKIDSFYRTFSWASNVVFFAEEKVAV